MTLHGIYMYKASVDHLLRRSPIRRYLTVTELNGFYIVRIAR